MNIHILKTSFQFKFVKKNVLVAVHLILGESICSSSGLCGIKQILSLRDGFVSRGAVIFQPHV